MNVQELSTIAEARINSADGQLKDYKALQLNLFKEQGLRMDPEDYKFTNLAKFFEALTPIDTSSEEVSASDIQSIPSFVFQDGELKFSPQINGLKVFPLNEKLSEVKGILSSQNSLNHLHHSLTDHGLVIEIEKNVRIDSPLRILHIITQGAIKAPTLVIKMKAFSELSLLEEFRGKSNSYAEVSEAYAELEAGAKLEHLQLDEGQSESLHHGSTWAKVHRDASYSNLVFHLSGKLSRRNLDLRLLESGSHGESYNLFLTSDTEHSDINTVINHEAPDTTSNQIAKGILGGESKGIFTGKIHIHPKAQRVVSGQINRNLLLSPKAQIHSQPQLEIFADDVKCSHGSTTGQLSPEEIFYFESRGLPAEKAKTLLAHGFGLEVVLKIKDQKLREYMGLKVMTALKDKFQLGDSK